MDSKEFREVAKAVIDDIANYHDNLSSHRVVSAVQPGYLRPLLPPSAPLDGEPLDAITQDVRDKILPGITHWQSPGFMAFFPCSSSFPATLAEMYSNALTGAHFNWICSPAVTELEMIVMDWLVHALALPPCFLSRGPTRGGGVLHGSASEAVLTVMVAARDKYLAALAAHDEDEDAVWRRRSRMVALGSAGTHSSTKKAAQILGVRFVTVPVREESGFAMQAEDLAAVVAELRAKGLEPFFLTATLGTTDVCAVDDLAGIARVLQEDHHHHHQQSLRDQPRAGEIWVHVDAAYAGSALLLEENQHLAQPLASFHSFNFNPHKWLLTNLDCSATFVRSRAHLVAALSIKPPYLRNEFSDNDLVTDYRDWQIPLGRRFRSLKLWFVLRSYGIRGLQAHLRQGIALAETLEARLVGRSDLFTIFTGARFGLLTFRVAPALNSGETDRDVSRRTEALYDAVNASGRFYLTSTVIQGKYVIRVCTGGANTKEETIQELFDFLVEAVERQSAKLTTSRL